MSFLLRPANLSDAKNIFDLSNEYLVRENSISKSIITWENHLIWLKNKIDDSNYRFYIIVDQSDNFIGQLRYEITNNDAVVSISLASNYRNKGLSSKILIEGSKKIMSENINKIFAYIRPDNQSSIKSFEKAGYIFDSKKNISNELVFVYVLKKEK